MSECVCVCLRVSGGRVSYIFDKLVISTMCYVHTLTLTDYGH